MQSLQPSLTGQPLLLQYNELAEEYLGKWGGYFAMLVNVLALCALGITQVLPCIRHAALRNGSLRSGSWLLLQRACQSSHLELGSCKLHALTALMGRRSSPARLTSTSLGLTSTRGTGRSSSGCALSPDILHAPAVDALHGRVSHTPDNKSLLGPSTGAQLQLASSAAQHECWFARAARLQPR